MNIQFVTHITYTLKYSQLMYSHNYNGNFCFNPSKKDGIDIYIDTHWTTKETALKIKVLSVTLVYRT